MVGARHFVSNEVPCVNFSPTTGYLVSLAIPNLESKQNGVEFAEGGSSFAKMCSEGLNYEGSGCCLDVAGSTPDDFLPVHDSTVQVKDSGAELLPSDGSLTLPMASAGLVEGLTPVSKGVHLECHPMASHRGQIELLPQRREVDVPWSEPGSGLPSEHAGGPMGITWSSVVTKNTHGAECGMAGTCCWLHFAAVKYGICHAPDDGWCWRDSAGAGMLSCRCDAGLLADGAGLLDFTAIAVLLCCRLWLLEAGSSCSPLMLGPCGFGYAANVVFLMLALLMASLGSVLGCVSDAGAAVEDAGRMVHAAGDTMTVLSELWLRIQLG